MDVGSISFSHVHDDPNVLITRHLHETAHFQLILNGEYVTEAARDNASVGPMTMLWIPAGTTHRDRFKTRGGTFSTISFLDPFISELESPALPSCATRIMGVESLTSVFVREMQCLDEFSLLALEGIAFQLMAYAGRQREREQGTSSAGRQAFAIIQERYRERLTLQNIAGELGLTARAVSVLLQRSYGRSLAQLLRERRVRHAIGQLAGRASELADIAIASGFADQAQFTKAFKQVTGQTPALFRQANMTRTGHH